MMSFTATRQGKDADLMARLATKLHNALMSQYLQELNNKRKISNKLGRNPNQDLNNKRKRSDKSGTNNNQDLNKKRKRSNKSGTNPNQDFPTWKIQKKRTGDRAAAKARLQEHAVLDAKPIARFDGKQVVNLGSSTSNEYKCTTCHKSFPTHQALGGHRSSHYVRDKKDPKQGIHTCKICLRTFPSGQALGGHKRFHYEGPLIIKRKAPSAGTSLTPTSQENSPSQSDCVKLIGIDLKKLSQVQEHSELSTNTSSSFPTSKINSPSQSDCEKLLGNDLKKLSHAQEEGRLVIAHKAPSTMISSMSASQENSTSQTDCVKLFGVDLKKLSQQAQEDKEINLDLTL